MSHVYESRCRDVKCDSHVSTGTGTTDVGTAGEQANDMSQPIKSLVAENAPAWPILVAVWADGDHH